MPSGLIQLLSSAGIPRDIAINATFYPAACLTLFFAILVVTSRNIFHSAIYLALTLIGVACVYLYLDAEFLAIIQVMIYVGAIVTLFIFTIMLTADIKTGPSSGAIRRMLVSAGASLAILFILIRVIAGTAWQAGVPCTISVQGLSAASFISLQQLGISLMSKYVLPLEVISLILLAALVGAIVIGKADKR